DLVASIMDNRLWDELERLKGTFGSPVLVVEELERAFERDNVKPASIYGALNYVATRYGVPTIPTRHARDTALLLYRMAVREQGLDRPPAKARKAPK
ncbi:MAG: ERCC4 domain-containing protein, partial [Promethearchaeota archaeon]